MKAVEQSFPVVLFIMLYKVILTFQSVDDILGCDHSNESYWAVLSCGTVYYAVQGGSKTFKSVDDTCGHANAVYFTLKGCPCGQNSIKEKKPLNVCWKPFLAGD